MNAILLTALTIAGVNGTSIDLHGGPAAAQCSECYSGGHAGYGGGRLHAHALRGHCGGPMPQTCYDPPYGCYPGTRHMHRYPAFHGTYYRRPYNYRSVFDYPWHADLHEPTSYFSYHVSGDPGNGLSQRPELIPQPPEPEPVAALPLHRQIEQATADAPSVRRPAGRPALRR
jgi:hypothetical protein